MRMRVWKRPTRVWTVCGALALGALVIACGEDGGAENAALLKRGKVVYDIHCTACHARKPAEPGPVGPPVAASSMELLEAKVLHNEYPPGYTPQRETQVMIPLAHLEKDLAAIYAFLQSERH